MQEIHIKWDWSLIQLLSLWFRCSNFQAWLKIVPCLRTLFGVINYRKIKTCHGIIHEVEDIEKVQSHIIIKCLLFKTYLDIFQLFGVDIFEYPNEDWICRLLSGLAGIVVNNSQAIHTKPVNRLDTKQNVIINVITFCVIVLHYHYVIRYHFLIQISEWSSSTSNSWPFFSEHSVEKLYNSAGWHITQYLSKMWLIFFSVMLQNSLLVVFV